MYFYDEKTRLDFSVLGRKNKTWVLMGAPSHASQNTLAYDLLLRRSDSDPVKQKASYFVKENGAWKATALPMPTQEECLEWLRRPARAIAAGEAKFFTANKRYSNDLDELNYDREQYVWCW